MVDTSGLHIPTANYSSTTTGLACLILSMIVSVLVINVWQEKSPVNRHHPMGHVPVSGRFERVAMDLLDVSVISAKGYKYILVVCDYFTKYTEAYPLKDKTARSVADALMDIWLPRYGFPLFLHSDQGKEFDNAMIHTLSDLLGTVKTKTTPYHPRSDGLVERFNRTLLAMLAMFVSQEHDNWDDLLPFMMLAYKEQPL